MQRESPRALVLNPSGEISGAHAPPGIFVLDKAFVLIEGHPRSGSPEKWTIRLMQLPEKARARSCPPPTPSPSDEKGIGRGIHAFRAQFFSPRCLLDGKETGRASGR